MTGEAGPLLVLASGSPRRRELLASLGLRFAVQAADVDETRLPGEDPGLLVDRLSRDKASRVAGQHPDALIVAADTVVVCGDEILGKPQDEAENRRFIELLSGRVHEVYTGHCLRLGRSSATRVNRTRVHFRRVAGAAIERYVASGEGRDKAGGYAIQGRGAALVPRIEGCYFNVVGLSLVTVVELAGELGVTLV